MLNPFQIRDLHDLSSLGPGESPSPDGVVQISASDYDDLASNHPRARLTYTDDDDGDQITVGSSLELSQRLDEPLDITPRLDAVQLSEDERVPMHIFDIRRSNSVSELWKQFEKRSSTTPQFPDPKNDHPAVTELTANASGQGTPPLAETSATASTKGDSQPPLLAAFEAELANILESDEEPAERAPQAEPSPAADSSRNANPHGFPHTAEALASQIMHHLVNGANMVQSELQTRLPELQRQVRDAQRHLPANIGMTLQALLTTLETHVRTAFNNLPDNGRQWANNGRHWAEEAIHAGRPVAENAAESFRMMASEVNGVGRSFIAAFEQELARASSQQTNMASDRPAPPHTTFPYPPSSTAAPAINTQTMEPRSMAPASGLQQNHTTGFDQSVPVDYRPTSHATMANVSNANPPPCPSWGFWGPAPNWAQFSPSESVHSQFLNRGPSCTAENMACMNAPAEQPPIVSQYDAPIPPPKYPQQSTFGGIASQTANSDPVNDPLSSGMPSSHLPASEISQTDRPGNKTLFIGNVGFKVTERTIQDVFASKGFIVDVDLPLDAVTGKHAGFGYLHFPSVYPAIAALDALQGAHIDGHAINLEYSDATPIDSVVSPSLTDNANVPSAQFSAQQKGKGSSEPKQTPSTSIKRRKSVTFKDPPMNERQTVTPESSNTEMISTQSSDKAPSAPLIDLSIDESTPTLRPPFSNEPWHHNVSQVKDETTFDWSPELHMSRFPPVSQVEAQVLANQRQHETFRPSAPQETRAVNHSDATTTPLATQSQYPSIWGAAGSFPHIASTDNLQRSRTVSHTLDEGHGNDDVGPFLRRANTTSSDQARGRQLRTSGLGRRAHERKSLRFPPPAESDAWARLNRRTRERSRPSSSHSIPGSFPVEEPPTSVQSDDAEVESCVSSLIDMGYGTPEDGGRSRMAVYAAASNNNLLEAIEMIEEERKAYERRQQ